MRNIFEADVSLSFFDFSSLDDFLLSLGDVLEFFLFILGDVSGELVSLPVNRPCKSKASPGERDSLRGLSEGPE